MVTLKIVANVLDEIIWSQLLLWCRCAQFRNHSCQNIAGGIIDKSGYEMMSFS